MNCLKKYRYRRLIDMKKTLFMLFTSTLLLTNNATEISSNTLNPISDQTSEYVKPLSEDLPDLPVVHSPF